MLKIGNDTSSTGTPVGKVVVWGTFSSFELSKVFDDISQANKGLIISYVQKQPSDYQQNLIEAFANGTGPDLFFITADMVKKDENFIYKIPFTSYAQKTFQDSFVDGGSAYLASDGVLGFPVVVDPMVLYYNKDILSNAGIASVPTSWDQLFGLASVLTQKKDDGTILQSMIGLGQYANITNAKDILATLLIQSGNPIINRTSTGYESVLSSSTSFAKGTSGAEQVLNFFTEFSNPSDQAYSWNRSLPDSRTLFTTGKLAFYLGHASELFNIQATNPNLSFDVATIPQPQGAQVNRTGGDIYAVAVNSKSNNITAAFQVAGIVSTGDPAKSFAEAVNLPPANRALLSTKPTDPYLYTFFNQSIITHTWLDPDSTATDAIFSEMVENVLSNKLSASDAVNKAQSELNLKLSN